MANKLIRRLAFSLMIMAGSLVLVAAGTIVISAGLMAFTITVPLKSRMCCETPARFGANYENANFLTADGLKLSGWYIPPRNGAVIILIHSYYGDRRQTLNVAEMLYKNGYGVLMYDQRASGESEGNVRSLGWRDIPDVSRAVEWVLTREKNARIGAYGCSVGGALALAGAAQESGIRAVAVEAPNPLEWRGTLPNLSLRDPLSLPVMALYYRFVMLRAGSPPTTSTMQAVQTYGVRPVLFISAGEGAEFSGVQAYFENAAGPKEHWNIPDSSHCRGSSDHPAEYQKHLVEFFNASLR